MGKRFRAVLIIVAIAAVVWVIVAMIAEAMFAASATNRAAAVAAQAAAVRDASRILALPLENQGAELTGRDLRLYAGPMGLIPQRLPEQYQMATKYWLQGPDGHSWSVYTDGRGRILVATVYTPVATPASHQPALSGP